MNDINKIDEQILEERIANILKRITEIKSIIAGRNTNFTKYTHEGDYRLRYSHLKTTNLIDELLAYIIDYYTNRNLSFDDNHSSFYKCFLYCVVLFCDISCNQSDWIFESFLKLADTVYKENSNEESTFDILVQDQLELYPTDSTIFMKYYNNFNDLFFKVYDYDYFEPSIRQSINIFLDNHKTSYYIDSTKYDNTISILENTIYDLISMRYEDEDTDL